MAKKKITEKVDTLKTLFESLKIKVEKDQLETFVKSHELLVDKRIKEQTNKFEKKTKEYQKRNAELASKLEESSKISEKIDMVLADKVKLIENIKVPSAGDILKLVEGKIKPIERSIIDNVTKKIKMLEKVGKKFEILTENVKKSTTEMQSVKSVDEELKKIQNVGNIFENYKTDFIQMVTESESKSIAEMKQLLDEKEKKIKGNEVQIEELIEENKREKESTEITIMLENANIEEDDRQLLYTMYEKAGYHAKEDIANFIKKKEQTNARLLDERKNLRGTQIINEKPSIKQKRNPGLIRKTVTESSHVNEMDEWVNLAGIDK